MTELTVELDRSAVAAAGSSVTASVRVQPGMADPDVTRHITLCIDTSGSMSGEKMAKVREGIRWVFGYLDDDDHLSIVTFDDEVEVVLPSTRWGDIGLDEADAVVDEMQAGGGTDILGGLERAYETLADLPTGPSIGRRILLLSDGRDERPTEAFADLARRVRREDAISVPAAGIGEYYDEGTIRTVGTASDAEWVHLSRADDIENFFGRKVETLGTIVAPSPNLEVELPKHAGIGDVFLRRPQVRDANYERVGDTVRVFLPDLLEFETQEVVFTVETPPCQAGLSFTLADVTLNTAAETATASAEVDCRAGASDADETVDSEITLKHLETMVRKAAGEGDLQRAETMVQQATGDADVGAGDPPVNADETQIRDDADDVVPVGADETQIRQTSRDLTELRAVMDAEATKELETVVDEASTDDLESQYETTKIADGDRE
jgi:Ca-activated chloride channel family protein